MKLKQNLFFFVFVLFSLVFTPCVFGLGVRPARQEVFFENNLQKDFYFTMLNNDGEKLSVSFSVSIRASSDPARHEVCLPEGALNVR